VRPHHPVIVATALAALALCGCGEDPGIEQGSVPFKKSRSEPYASQIDEMKKVVREQAYVKKSGGERKPAADTGPASDTRTATKGR
jgi:hypothetical protein